MSPLEAKPPKMAQEVFEGITVAQRLRAELDLRPEAPLDCIVEVAEQRLAIDVVLAPLVGGVSGFYLPLRPTPVVVVEQSHPVQRQRFTIAHEIGHHALGHAAAPRIHGDAPPSAAPEGPSADASGATEPPSLVGIEPPPASGSGTPDHYRPRRAPNEEERAANAFAGELLVPHAGAQRVLARWAGDNPLDLVVRLSAHYGASAFSALVRIQALKLVDWRTARDLRQQLAAGAHLERYAELGLAAVDDTLQRHADDCGGPRCSPRARRALATLRAEFDALA